MPSAAADNPDAARFGVVEIILLGFVFGIAAFATDMYQPAFPAIRAAFAASAADVQLSLSLFLYGNAAGHLVLGPLSDRYGRKPVLLFGLGAYAAASLGCALAQAMPEFLLSRALQGAAAASGPVLIRALVNDRLERRQAAAMLALLTGCMALAAMLTPVAGGWLVEQQDWRWIFFLMAGLGAALLLLVQALTTETLPPVLRMHALGAAAVTRAYLDVARSGRFWAYVTPPALMFSAVFAWVGVNSFLLIDELGLSAQHQGMSFSLAASAYVAGSFASNRLVHFLGIERGISWGLVFGLICALAAVVASVLLPLSYALVLVPALSLFFATALIVPIGLSAAVSLFPAHGGSASAVAGFTQLSFAGASSALIALVVESSTLPLHLYTLGACIGAGLCWLGGRRLRHNHGLAA